MSRSLSYLACLILAGLAGGCGDKTTPPAPPPPSALSAEELSRPLPSPLPDVAARVNGQAIPMRNVALVARQTFGNQLTEENKPRFVREAVYKLIVRELLYQESQARRLQPDQKAMTQAYDEARVAYKDDAAWNSFLKSQGLDPQTFQAELRIQFTVRAVLDWEAAQVPNTVGEEEAKAFYMANPQLFDSGERLRVRHILIRVPPQISPASKAELRKRAEGLLARLRKGQDFATLARENSEDIGSKGKGGELQIFSRGQMHNTFERAAHALKPGQLSDVVETPYGFHVIRMEQRLPSEKVIFEKALPAIRQQIVERRRERHLERLVGQLKAKARIETYL